MRYKVIVIFFLFCFTFSACQKKYTKVKDIFVLDTVMSLYIKKSNTYDNNELINKAIKEIKRLEKIFNVHITNSELSRVNNAAYDFNVNLSEELGYLLKKSFYFAKLTKGAFDPTLLRLKILWKMPGPPLFQMPSEAQVLASKKKTGYKKVVLKNNKVKFKISGIGFDLGAIAKGYIIDKVAMIFKKHGVKSAYINIGGDVFLIGKKENRKWIVGIQHPRDKNKMLSVLRLTDMAVVTSGDYQRYRIIKNKRYHHIINPKTGYPAWNCISATVIAENAMTADALSTAVFVMGPDKGINFINKVKNTEAMIVYIKNGKMLMKYSKNFRKYR